MTQNKNIENFGSAFLVGNHMVEKNWGFKYPIPQYFSQTIKKTPPKHTEILGKSRINILIFKGITCKIHKNPKEKKTHKNASKKEN